MPYLTPAVEKPHLRAIRARALSCFCLVGNVHYIESFTEMGIVAVWGSCYVRMPSPACQADDQVPQAHQHLRGGPSAHLRAALLDW